MEKTAIQFEAGIVFDDDTIRRMFRAEYYTYETVQRLLRLILGMAGILATLFLNLPAAARVIFLMFGVWLLVAGDFPSKVLAEGVIEKRGGKSSQVRYRFRPDGVQIEGSGFIPYRSLDKLVYDEEYLYLFVNRQNAVMLSVRTVKPADPERLRALIEKESGKVWKRLTTGILEYNIRDILTATDSLRKNKSKAG
ncbi:MAG: YcxB family protein [Clostridiales bacterium]|nr:YcxB family protein [Clostridiales bacterium]